MQSDESVTWNPALETLIAEEAERCAGLSWIHKECENHYSSRTNWIVLPGIVLSTANGFISGSSQLIFNNQTASSIGVGVISLFTGLLTTVGSYFAWARRTEAHKISSLQYQKMSKFLTIELTLPMNERVHARDILKITREQIERLLEISPSIPKFILNDYRRTFKDYKDVAHPEIISGLKKVVINTTKEQPDIKNSKIKISIA
jgi:hypothetical protein